MRARTSGASARPPAARSPHVVTTFVPCSSGGHHVVERERARHVDDAVGAQRLNRGAIRRRRDAGRGLTAELARVEPDLLRVVHEHTDELEIGVADDLAQRARPDVPGGPLHDSRHGRERIRGMIGP